MALRKRMFSSWMFSIALGLLLTMTGTVLTAHAAMKDDHRLPLEDVQRFSAAISQIKNYYVQSVKDKDLFENAIRGMLKGLDPHSAYLNEEDYRDLRVSTKGEFGGLGIEVTMEHGLLKVISPIDDTPAQKAGIKAGDYIIRINEKPIKDITLRDAVNIMRGPKGSKIKLLILRKGDSKPLTFHITRAVIRIKTVKSRLLDHYFAYLRISHFQEPTANDMFSAIKDLKKQANGKLKGLILDLRNNPGGLLDSAIEISDAFIHNDKKGHEELIVYTKGRLPSAEFKAKATPGDVLHNIPIVVLINEGSASGSEIVAGALKDNKRAIILGTKSFGKGSVQTVLPLDDKRGIKLTTALYYTPTGRSIQAEGIMPDIIVKDIKFPLPKKVDNQIDFLKEADLKGHLKNDHKTKEDKKQSASDEKLLHEDYQLYEALNLLKGLALLKK